MFAIWNARTLVIISMVLKMGTNVIVEEIQTFMENSLASQSIIKLVMYHAPEMQRDAAGENQLLVYTP